MPINFGASLTQSGHNNGYIPYLQFNYFSTIITVL